MVGKEFEVEEVAVSVHFAFEPGAFLEVVREEIDKFALATEEASDELALVHDVTLRKTQVPQSVELPLLELTRIVSQVVCKPERPQSIDVVLLELSLVHAATREVELSLPVSLAFKERAFVQRGGVLVSYKFTSLFLRLKETFQRPNSMEEVSLPRPRVLCLASLAPFGVGWIVFLLALAMASVCCPVALVNYFDWALLLTRFSRALDCGKFAKPFLVESAFVLRGAVVAHAHHFEGRFNLSRRLLLGWRTITSDRSLIIAGLTRIIE